MTTVSELLGRLARRRRSEPDPATPLQQSESPETSEARPWQVAQQLEWGGERPPPGFFRELRDRLAGVEEPVMLLAVGSRADTWVDLVETTWPGLRLVVLHAEEDPSQAHARLSASGPYDVVVQVGDASARSQVRLFQRIFFHLRDGGSYLTPTMLPWEAEDDSAAAAEPVVVQREDGPRAAPYDGDLWSLVAAAQSARMHGYVDRDGLGLAHLDLTGLGRRVRDIWVRGRILRILAEDVSQPKLTEGEADAVLAELPEVGTEVASVPPRELRAAHRVVHDLEGPDPYYDEVTPAPKMTLRRYDAPLCSRGQVVTSHGFLLPDTFRFPSSPRPTNIYVDEAAPRFGKVRRDLSRAVDLPGVWFHLDSEWPGSSGT